MEVEELKTLISNKQFIRKVQYVLIALFLLVVVLDIYLALDKEDNNTISNVIQRNTDNGLFVLTYLWGAVAANLFFIRFKPPIVNNTIGSIVIIGVALMIIIFNIEYRLNEFLTTQDYNFSVYFLSMAFGVLMGLLFWRQHENKITTS